MNKTSVFVILGVVPVLCSSVLFGVLLGVYFPMETSSSDGSDDSRDDLPELPVTSPWYGNEDIKIFRQYLRIPTVYPDIEYEPCVEFLKKQAASLDLPVAVYYPVEKNPVVVMTWIGSQPNLPSIMLNSHTDVVPVFEESWSHPPFVADMDEAGRIFARGSQDTKGVGMLYLAAIRELKRTGTQQLKRTIHIVFVPDEEMGGLLGMAEFVLTNEFRALNIGYALDEGSVSEGNIVSVTYDERCTWRTEFIAHINRWCQEAGGNITINYIIKDSKAPKTPVDETNPMWVVLEQTTKEFGMEVVAEVPRGASDMKYLRRLNIPSLGFSPLINTPRRAHDHDEFVQADVYLAGIGVYTKLIFNFGDI